MPLFAFLPLLLAAEPCRITVVDAENGWPVPLVELRTTSELKFVTDNAGVIAFDAPEYMNRETWFHVRSHGYEVPKDGFGYRGVRLTPIPGGTLTVKVTRTMPAKRVGRISGSGLFAESQKLGDDKDWPESGLTGCDTVQTAVFGGKRFWLWGDTNLPHYPLGIFHVLAATSDSSPYPELQPPLKPKFDYFRDARQRPRGVAPFPGEGPTWLMGLATVPDRNGSDKLVASYVKTRGYLVEYEWGLCAWNDAKTQFEPLKKIWTRTAQSSKPPPLPDGHAIPWTDDAGKRWLLFGDPFPHLKCPADFERWQDPASWVVIDKPELPPTKSGETIRPHRGSIGWHAWRKKFVSVLTQSNGKSSNLGEIWYTESKSPFGPWSAPIQVLTHDNYTFYNPMVHPDLTKPDSPVLLFEGTYTAEFARNAVPTPRYNYNQMLYRIDLDRPPFMSNRP